MTESANLLNDSCPQDESLYHEMEITEGLSVETKDSVGCISISGSTRYLLAAVVASLGGVLFGYDLGIVSGAMLQLKQEFKLDCQQQEMVVSSMLFGALLGSLTGGYIIDSFGRRRTIIINAFVFFAGALLLAFAPSYGLLIVGRLIVGFGTSLSAIAECIYIAEIAPPKRRGLLVSVNEIGIVFGLLLAYLVNYVFINTGSGWRYMFGISGIPALIQGYGVIFLPPSPRWLICQGQDAKALHVVRLLNHGTVPEEEISKMKDALNLEQKYNICYLFGRNANMRDRMLVGLGIVFFQQFTGQPSVLYYAPSIFENIGFRSHSAATLATVGIGLTKLFATVITLCLVDKAGRRRFLLVGSFVMTVGIFLLYTVTLSFPGTYHHEICEITRNHPNQYKNLTLMPSFSINTSTCNNHVSIRDLDKSVSLERKPYSNTISMTQSTKTIQRWNIKPSLPVTTLTGHTSPILTRRMPSSLPSKLSRDFNEKKLVCSSPSTPPDGRSKINNSKEGMPNVVKYVTVFSLMAFAGGYSAGYGPVSWLILSEIFPTPIKGRAFAATTVLNWGSNLVVSLTMLDLIDSVGVSWTFFIYGIIGMLAMIFIYKFVPETKNRSLEEINVLFSTRNPFLQDCTCFPSSRSFCCNHYNSISSSSVRDQTLMFEEEWEPDSSS